MQWIPVGFGCFSHSFNLVLVILKGRDHLASQLLKAADAPTGKQREGDAVDFDDFFLFADNFGKSEGDVGYDPLFDISPNGAVDFDDFFRFADDFGKVVANALSIQG